MPTIQPTTSTTKPKANPKSWCPTTTVSYPSYLQWTIMCGANLALASHTHAYPNRHKMLTITAPCLGSLKFSRGRMSGLQGPSGLVGQNPGGLSCHHEDPEGEQKSNERATKLPCSALMLYSLKNHLVRDTLHQSLYVPVLRNKCYVRCLSTTIPPQFITGSIPQTPKP
eukprot:434942-Amphidinium_carterae.1